MSPDDCILPKFSIGVGDRFAQQAKPQLQACKKAREAGVEVIPVWNKSNREHTIVGSGPKETRAAADAAVKALGWTLPYFVDADHINLQNVDRFLEPCDFFTIDVADRIGQSASDEAIERFLAKHDELIGKLSIPGIDEAMRLDRESLTAVLRKYLSAAEEAGRIYEYVAGKKGQARFVAEVSMDETDAPQTPLELLVILVALSDEGVQPQTIAPKFAGRFNKGVGYEGDLGQFAREFSEDIAVIAYSVKNYGLPGNLKLSVHSGSDKFSLYPVMHDLLKKSEAGVHLKTAGTNWLEELIGLAQSGGEGLAAVKEIYAGAFEKKEELAVPYAAVIDIDPAKLPGPEQVNRWTADQFVAALRHDPQSSAYNPSLRQLLHIGFKIAAQMGSRYIELVQKAEPQIANDVTDNLFDRHLKPLFLGAA